MQDDDDYDLFADSSGGGHLELVDIAPVKAPIAPSAEMMSERPDSEESTKVSKDKKSKDESTSEPKTQDEIAAVAFAKYPNVPAYRILYVAYFMRIANRLARLKEKEALLRMSAARISSEIDKGFIRLGKAALQLQSIQNDPNLQPYIEQIKSVKRARNENASFIEVDRANGALGKAIYNLKLQYQLPNEFDEVCRLHEKYLKNIEQAEIAENAQTQFDVEAYKIGKIEALILSGLFFAAIILIANLSD